MNKQNIKIKKYKWIILHYPFEKENSICIIYGMS